MPNCVQAIKSSELVGRSYHAAASSSKPHHRQQALGEGRGVRADRYSDPFNAPKGLFKHKARGWKPGKLGTSGVRVLEAPFASRSARTGSALRLNA